MNLNEVPSFRLLLLFAMGILLADYFSLEYIPVLLLSLVGGTIFLVAILAFSRSRMLSGIVISALMLLAGCAAFQVSRQDILQNYVENNPGQEIVVEGLVVSDPVIKKNTRFTVKLEKSITEEKIETVNGLVLVYLAPTSKTDKVKAGDRVMLKGRVHETTGSKNPLTFDYKEYLHNQGIDHQLFVKDGGWLVMASHQRSWIMNVADQTRQHCLSIFQKYIPDRDALSIIAAMTLGVRHLISEDLYDTYTDTGAVHVLAVSGLHVGIISLLLIWLFNFFPRKNKLAVLIQNLTIVGLIWLFAFVTGGAPAVLRASTMFTFYILGRSYFGGTNAYNVLGISAIFLLLVDPRLLYQVSFQFSYMALFSIIYFQPIVSALWRPDSWILEKLWTLINVSIAAQILVFPLTIYYFHKLPTYFILSGVLAVPAAFMVLSMSMLILMLEMITPFLSSMVALLLNSMVKLFISFLQLIQELPHSSFENLWLDNEGLIVIYLILFSIMIWISYAKPKMVFVILSLLVFSFIHANKEALSHQDSRKAMIYDIRHGYAVDIINGQECVSYVDQGRSMSDMEYIASNYRMSQSVRVTKVITAHDSIDYFNLSSRIGYLEIYDKVLAIPTKESALPTVSMPVDALWITSDNVYHPRKVLDKYAPKVIILDHSISYNYYHSWFEELVDTELIVLDIRQRGATDLMPFL